MALVLAGCGDDKKKSTSSGGTLTKTEYIAKADRICAAGKKAVDRGEKQLNSLPANAQVEDTVPGLETGLDASRTARNLLRALPEPSEGKATLDAFLASVDKNNAAGGRLLAAAKAGDVAKFKQLSTSDDLGVNKRLGKAYGFKRCGTGK